MECSNCKRRYHAYLPGQRQCVECLRIAVKEEPQRMDKFTAGMITGMVFETAAIVLYLMITRGA